MLMVSLFVVRCLFVCSLIVCCLLLVCFLFVCFCFVLLIKCMYCYCCIAGHEEQDQVFLNVVSSEPNLTFLSDQFVQCCNQFLSSDLVLQEQLQQGLIHLEEDTHKGFICQVCISYCYQEDNEIPPGTLFVTCGVM